MDLTNHKKKHCHVWRHFEEIHAVFYCLLSCDQIGNILYTNEADRIHSLVIVKSDTKYFDKFEFWKILLAYIWFVTISG